MAWKEFSQRTGRIIVTDRTYWIRLTKERLGTLIQLVLNHPLADLCVFTTVPYSPHLCKGKVVMMVYQSYWQNKS